MKTIATIIFLLSSPTFAKVVDLSKYQTPAKAQLNRDTCAYFATASIVEAAIAKSFNKKVDISEQYQVFREKAIHGDRTDVEFGDTYSILMNSKKDLYFHLESTLPYQDTWFTKGKPCAGMNSYNKTAPEHCFSQGPVSISEDVKRIEFRGMKVSTVSGLWSSKSRSGLIIDEIDKENSIAITLLIAPKYINDKTGHFKYDAKIDKECAAGKLTCGGHAVALMGYDTEKKIFKFKNSWGPKWGDSGFGYVSFEHVDLYSDQPIKVEFDRWNKDFWIR